MSRYRRRYGYDIMTWIGRHDSDPTWQLSCLWDNFPSSVSKIIAWLLQCTSDATKKTSSPLYRSSKEKIVYSQACMMGPTRTSQASTTSWSSRRRYSSHKLNTWRPTNLLPFHRKHDSSFLIANGRRFVVTTCLPIPVWSPVYQQVPLSIIPSINHCYLLFVIIKNEMANFTGFGNCS